MCSALPGPAWVNATCSSSALREGGKPGNAVAGICTMLLCWDLQSTAALHAARFLCTLVRSIGLLSCWRRARCLEITRLSLHPQIFLVYRFNLCSKWASYFTAEFTKLGRYTISGSHHKCNSCSAESLLLAAQSWQSTASAHADPAWSSSGEKMWMPGLHSRAESTDAAKGRSELPWEPSFPSFPGQTIRHHCPGAICVGVAGGCVEG